MDEGMSFTANLPAAAHRHLDAADALASATPPRRPVAAYLYGLAAELALKAMAESVPALRTDAILYAHFPELRTYLRDALSGRTARALASLVHNDAFMNNWHISMRYADGRQVRDEWVSAWQQQARLAVSTMGT